MWCAGRDGRHGPHRGGAVVAGQRREVGADRVLRPEHVPLHDRERAEHHAAQQSERARADPGDPRPAAQRRHEHPVAFGLRRRDEHVRGVRLLLLLRRQRIPAAGCFEAFQAKLVRWVGGADRLIPAVAATLERAEPAQHAAHAGEVRGEHAALVGAELGLSGVHRLQRHHDVLHRDQERPERQPDEKADDRVREHAVEPGGDRVDQVQRQRDAADERGRDGVPVAPVHEFVGEDRADRTGVVVELVQQPLVHDDVPGVGVRVRLRVVVDEQRRNRRQAEPLRAPVQYRHEQCTLAPAQPSGTGDVQQPPFQHDAVERVGDPEQERRYEDADQRTATAERVVGGTGPRQHESGDEPDNRAEREPEKPHEDAAGAGQEAVQGATYHRQGVYLVGYLALEAQPTDDQPADPEHDSAVPGQQERERQVQPRAHERAERSAPVAQDAGAQPDERVRVAGRAVRERALAQRRPAPPRPPGLRDRPRLRDRPVLRHRPGPGRRGSRLPRHSARGRRGSRNRRGDRDRFQCRV